MDPELFEVFVRRVHRGDEPAAGERRRTARPPGASELARGRAADRRADPRRSRKACTTPAMKERLQRLEARREALRGRAGHGDRAPSRGCIPNLAGDLPAEGRRAARGARRAEDRRTRRAELIRGAGRGDRAGAGGRRAGDRGRGAIWRRSWRLGAERKHPAGGRVRCGLLVASKGGCGGRI